MTYLMQSAIGTNTSMQQRVAQCAAEQGVGQPDQWMGTNLRAWSAAPGWADAWASALEANKDNPTYDPGKDEAVITDAQILSQVQSMVLPAA